MRKILALLTILALLGAVPTALAEAEAPTAAAIVDELNEIGFKLPELAEGETLWVGVSTVPQAEKVFIVFALSEDGTKATKMNVYLRNMDANNVSASKLSLVLSTEFDVGPEPADYDMGTLKILDFYVDGGQGGCEFHFTLKQTLPGGPSIEVPFDPAFFTFLPVEAE